MLNQWHWIHKKDMFWRWQNKNNFEKSMRFNNSGNLFERMRIKSQFWRLARSVVASFMIRICEFNNLWYIFSNQHFFEHICTSISTTDLLFLAAYLIVNMIGHKEKFLSPIKYIIWWMFFFVELLLAIRLFINKSNSKQKKKMFIHVYWFIYCFFENPSVKDKYSGIKLIIAEWKM